jgi:hypothetical protein
MHPSPGSARVAARTSPIPLALALAACYGPERARVGFAATPEHIAIAVEGRPFTELLLADPPSPVLWPLLAHDGTAVTRAFPLAIVAGEPHDHPHHRSLWFAHGDLNGVDFWTGKGTIAVDRSVVDADEGSIRLSCRWLDPSGREICRDERALQFDGGPDWRAVDLDLTLIASAGPLRLGDTKEGTFALRLRPELCFRGERAAGTAFNSAGDRDGAAWGKRATWVCYAAPVDGAPLSVAMFDHPENPVAPTYWHARDYGLFAANPFGAHDFANGPKDGGAVTLAAGGRLRFRYRVWIARRHCEPLEVEALRTAWLEDLRRNAQG